MKKYTVIIFILTLILFSNLVLAKQVYPSLSSMDRDDTLFVVSPLTTYFEAGVGFNFTVHVFNSSGFLLTPTNTDCELEIHDKVVNFIIEENMNENGHKFFYFVNGSNISNVGTYSYLVYCNSTQTPNQYGFLNGNFFVTNNGEPKSEDTFLVAVISLLPLILSLILIIGAAVMPKEHLAFRTGMMLFSLFGGVASLVFAFMSVGKFYDFQDMISWMGTYQYIIAIMFFIFFVYLSIFMSFMFLTWRGRMKQAKQEGES